MDTTALRTPAWRLIGLTRSEPGVLALADGRLAYWTDGGVAFDVPLGEVSDVVFPWYYFNGGAKLTADGEAYRFSFVEPNDAQPIPDHLLGRAFGGVGAAGVVAKKTADIARGRRAGKAWREALGA